MRVTASTRRSAVGLLALAGALSLVAPGMATAESSAKLGRGWIVPLERVDRFFPQVTRQAGTGKNTTASGKPLATRQVIYANHDESKKVTLSVDLYAKRRRALNAFKDAARRSRHVHGFSPLPAPNVGQRASAGTVTQGDETHVGLAAVQGSLIVQATIAGYDATHAKISRLVALSRVEVRRAKRRCSRKAGCSPR
jgi:hypothetical protein